MLDPLFPGARESHLRNFAVRRKWVPVEAAIFVQPVHPLSPQKRTFAPICRTREEFPVLLMVPNDEPLFRSLFGEPKTTLLNRLKPSARNSTLRSPQNGNCRKTD